eukprot:TRINITY_DN8031_c0_g1::TRINITY_DN8031_c0_g1_i1::g.20209::m.20209 TRINITY_DN8031_c0_g1::TRINITY_DN8031_c0_g1_i1::g.20209  ORF type:complete len:131 (+),score=8.99 TRINITY_DN8031_c0_g1_i1:359-751(+)
MKMPASFDSFDDALVSSLVKHSVRFTILRGPIALIIDERSYCSVRERPSWTGKLFLELFGNLMTMFVSPLLSLFNLSLQMISCFFSGGISECLLRVHLRQPKQNTTAQLLHNEKYIRTRVSVGFSPCTLR